MLKPFTLRVAWFIAVIRSAWLIISFPNRKVSRQVKEPSCRESHKIPEGCQLTSRRYRNFPGVHLEDIGHIRGFGRTPVSADDMPGWLHQR